MGIVYIDSPEKIDDIKSFLNKLSDSSVTTISLDTETTGLDVFSDEFLLLQIKVQDEIYIFNRGKLGKRFFTNLVKQLNTSGVLCIGHNIKFDTKVLKRDTDILLQNIYDTMVAEVVLTCGIGDKLISLRTLLSKYCNVTVDKEIRLEFLNMNHDSMFSSEQINYAATDVHYLLDIYTKQIEQARKDDLIPTFDLEMGVLPWIAQTEYNGNLIDIPYWKKLADKAKEDMNKFEIEAKNLILSLIDHTKFKDALEFANAINIPVKLKRDQRSLSSITDPSLAFDWVNNNFNIGSPKQLKTTLNIIGIEVDDTNEKTLNKLPKSPVIATLLNFRESEKRYGTYGENFLRLINPVTGRIHTEYLSIGTVTGRLSSRGPNLQNIIADGGYREGFISRHGYSLVMMDYSQQEYRLTGAISREPKIIEAYLAGRDMHIATAAIIFEKKLDDTIKEERDFGKTLNYAILYGTSEFGLKYNLSISIDKAKDLIKKFWGGYPTLYAFKNAVESQIMKLGYSVTPLGRRRYFDKIPEFSTPFEIMKYQDKMKREGFNMIIQGGSADVTKLAMLRLGRENPFTEDEFRVLLQVHDEIVAEVRDDKLEEARVWMRGVMESSFQPLLGEIPAKVDDKIGKRWTK